MALFFGFALLFAQSVSAESLQLAWDAVPDNRVAVYEVHYGVTSGQYQHRVDSPTSSATLTGLQPGTTYFLAVRACDASRANCSAFSDELSTTIAAPPPAAPVAGFTSSETTGEAPLTVLFTDTSSGSVTAQDWQFGDGNGTTNTTAVNHTFTTPGSYNVQLTVTGPGGSDVASQTIVVLAPESNNNGGDSGNPPPGDDSNDSGTNNNTGTGGSGVPVEVGEIEIDHQWQRVDFDNTFVDPVVVMKSLSDNSSDPAVIRIDAVDPTGFLVRVQEWDHQDGVHVPETASYIVVERGTHQLPDGSWIEAGTVDINATGGFRSFTTVPLTASFAAKPVVTAAVNTVNDSQAITVRLHRVRTDEFRVMLQEGEAFDQVHATETVAFIAWEPSVGTLDGRPYEVGTSSNNVTQEGREIVFNGTYASPPSLLADMQTSDGSETANVRWKNKSETSVDVWIDEEDSKDNEVKHTTEQVGYFVFGAVSASNDGNDSGGNNNPPATPPVAAFSSNATTGEAPLTVLFTDTSTGDVTAQDWQFDDGNGTTNASAVTHTFTTPGSYNVELTVTGPGGSDVAFETIVVLAPENNNGGDSGNPPPDDGSQNPPPDDGNDNGGSTGNPGPGNSGVLVEVREIEIDHLWQRIDFDNTFVDPVVVMKSMDGDGNDPAVIRIDAVESTGFMVRVQEWDHLDGTHVPEKATYMVMERGTHQLPDGSWIEAGTVDINATSGFRSFTTVPLTASFATKPVVAAAVNTVNDAQAVTVRLDRVRTNEFRMMLQEGEAFDKVHATETVAFIAWEPSVGTLDGRPFEVGSTGNSVTHKKSEITFSNTYALPPAFVADMQTSDGSETANVRWIDKRKKSVDVWIDEEDSKDTEVKHTTEQVGYFVFGQ